MASIINAATSGGLISTADTSGVLQLQTASTTAMTVTAGQLVGIGTASPATKLQVAGITKIGVTGTNGELQLARTSDGATITTFLTDGTSGIINSAVSTTFQINTAEAMRIDSDGNVLIGTTTRVGSFSKQSISVNGATHYGLGINDANSVNSASFLVFQASGTTIGSITNNNSTGVLYNVTSDYRLKDNIAPMTGALAKVAQLKPVTYKWKLNNVNGQGFIAHELAEVFPDAVVGEKDAVETYTDEDDNEQTRIKPQGIDTSVLVATLTAAIQEQQAIITQLQADVAALKGAK